MLFYMPASNKTDLLDKSSNVFSSSSSSCCQDFFLNKIDYHHTLYQLTHPYDSTDTIKKKSKLMMKRTIIILLCLYLNFTNSPTTAFTVH